MKTNDGSQGTVKKRSTFERFLDFVEVVGNKLPDPVIIFAVLTAAVTVVSFIGAMAGWTVQHPSTGKPVTVFNLLSPAGLQYMLSNCYQNYANFAPFAIAMPLFLAVGIMDKSGLLECLFIGIGSRVRGRWLTMVNPNYPELFDKEVPEYFKQKEIVGFKVHPELSGDYPLNGKNFAKMFEYASEHHIPILSHTYFGGDRLSVFEELAKRYPEANLIIGHVICSNGT